MHIELSDAARRLVWLVSPASGPAGDERSSVRVVAHADAAECGDPNGLSCDARQAGIRRTDALVDRETEERPDAHSDRVGDDLARGVQAGQQP
jgi:hypothetical protein